MVIVRFAAMLFLALAAPCALAMEGADLDVGDAPPAELAAFLDKHNRVRAGHCAPPLVWSAEVARWAQAWADELSARGCAFEHSHGRFGENLALGIAGVHDNPAEIADLWYRELDEYHFGFGGFSLATGHFTQMIWANSRRLGCGTSTCSGKRIWVCQYDPPGNYRGEYARNVRPWVCR